MALGHDKALGGLKLCLIHKRKEGQLFRLKAPLSDAEVLLELKWRKSLRCGMRKKPDRPRPVSVR